MHRGNREAQWRRVANTTRQGRTEQRAARDEHRVRIRRDLLRTQAPAAMPYRHNENGRHAPTARGSTYYQLERDARPGGAPSDSIKAEAMMA